jgi:site-specific DNA recombinase
MKAHTSHESRQQVAVGYIRVSTHEQAHEGVSLDAQRDKLRSYCKGMGIKLVEVFADEGISGGTMERPGLQDALRVLERGRANTLVVVKLDRLTRSVKDLCMLVEDYFSKDRYDLISLCGMVNTHTAAGRLMMMNVANYAQYERELISERTREARQHMKAQGVRLGVSSYGYRHSQNLDDNGRRILEPVAAEQEVIRQMAAWHAEGHQMKTIASMLKEKGIPARRGGEWHATVISMLLAREGHHERNRFKKTPSVPLICDMGRAAGHARQLRAEGLSLREIGRRLRKEGLVPPRGGAWHAASVAEVLVYRSEADPVGAAERARDLREQGCSLRAIAGQLIHEGHIPPRGGRWYAASIASLLRH